MEDLGLFTFSYLLTLNIACATYIDVCDKKGWHETVITQFCTAGRPVYKNVLNLWKHPLHCVETD